MFNHNGIMKAYPIEFFFCYTPFIYYNISNYLKELFTSLLFVYMLIAFRNIYFGYKN